MEQEQEPSPQTEQIDHWVGGILSQNEVGVSWSHFLESQENKGCAHRDANVHLKCTLTGCPKKLSRAIWIHFCVICPGWFCFVREAALSDLQRSSQPLSFYDSMIPAWGSIAQYAHSRPLFRESPGLPLTALHSINIVLVAQPPPLIQASQPFPWLFPRSRAYLLSLSLELHQVNKIIQFLFTH